MFKLYVLFPKSVKYHCKKGKKSMLRTWSRPVQCGLCCYLEILHLLDRLFYIFKAIFTCLFFFSMVEKVFQDSKNSLRMLKIVLKLAELHYKMCWNAAKLSENSEKLLHYAVIYPTINQKNKAIREPRSLRLNAVK